MYPRTGGNKTQISVPFWNLFVGVDSIRRICVGEINQTKPNKSQYVASRSDQNWVGVLPATLIDADPERAPDILHELETNILRELKTQLKLLRGQFMQNICQGL